MRNFGEWLSRLGHLHDCAVTLIEWRPNQRTIGFDIEDLYFNFENLLEYRGPLAGRIALEQIERLAIDVDEIAGPLRIHEFSVEEEAQAKATVTITFWPAGRIKARCRGISFPDVALSAR